MVKLVIADDHIVIREALCELLSKKGNYEIVGQASDGEELLEVLKNCEPDVVILDMYMPKIDGIAALQKLQNQEKAPPVLMLSAEESGKNVKEAFQAGAKGFITKNSRPEELEFAIDSVLHGYAYVSPAVTLSLVTLSLVDHESKPVPQDKTLLGALTKREVEILTHLADGKTNREIAKLLHISIRTVDTHRSNILKKLKLKTNAQLTKLALACNLISV